MATLFVGQRFSNFEEFKQSKKKYEDENFVLWETHKSFTIKSYNKVIWKRGSSEFFPSDLVFQNIKYVCKHGGPKRVGSGKGERRMQE